MVDNGSTDASPAVARRLGARVAVFENIRVSELRNRGARLTTGKVLAFVDADNEIAQGWVDSALAILGMPGVGAAGAAYRSPANGTWVQRAFEMHRGRTQGQHEVSWLRGGNLVVSRAAFDGVGGFDTSLETCEDVDLCHRMRSRGFRLIGDARLDSTHHGDPRTLRDLFRAEIWRGRDNLRVTFRRPFSWSAVPSAIIPVVDLGMIGAAGGGFIGLIAGWIPGLTLSVAALLIFTLGASLKVIRGFAQQRDATLVDLVQGFVVSCVFDLSRALAIVARAPHRNVYSRTAAATL